MEDFDFIDGKDETFKGKDFELKDDDNPFDDQDEDYVPNKNVPKRKRTVTKTTKKGTKTVTKHVTKRTKATKATKTTRPSKKRKTKEEDSEEGEESNKPLDMSYQVHLKRNPTLMEVQEMIEKVNSTSGSNGKKEYLLQYAHCVKALLYVNNPYWQYHVTSDNVEKLRRRNLDYKQLGVSTNNIFELLDILKSQRVTGHAAVASVLWFISKNVNFRDLIYCFLDKNLKIRCNTKSINKVFPKLIPEFSVALADKMSDDLMSSIDFYEEEWLASQKFDGARCLVFCYEPNNIIIRSREGNEFPSLHRAVSSALKPLKLKNVVLDCEGCLINPDGSENFSGMISALKKKDVEIENPRMKVFDILTMQEFEDGQGTTTYKERLHRLENMVGDAAEPVFVIAEQIRATSEDHLQEMAGIAEANGWEGLILRRASAVHKGRRTKDMLKIKKFEREEFKVQSLEIGPMRIKLGQEEKTMNVLKKVNILVDGTMNGVGSGFTPEERINFAKNPGLIKGKIIAVQYFEKTKNKKGDVGLRFPTFKGIYGIKRDI